MAKLIKIDKNGSKHYEGIEKCDKCGGVGLVVHHMENGMPSYNWTDGGVCWKCLGTGKVVRKWIERTPEYQAKLDARRKAKLEAKEAEQRKQADEINANFFKQQGFNAEGKTWAVLGDTYSIKDKLKQLGCKYNNLLGWHIDHQLEEFDTLMLDVDECYYKDYAGIYRWHQWIIDGSNKIKEATESLRKSSSKHVGNVGDKISITATLTGYHCYETQYGNVNIYTFTDIFKNVFVWKTSCYLEKNVDGLLKPVQKGERIEIVATVKGHDEYKGVKQTVLTRCKIKKAEA